MNYGPSPRNKPAEDSRAAAIQCLTRALRLALFLAIGAVATTASAQEWARKMFDTTNFDFGTVARGSKVEHRFVFTNLYEEDVHVASVRSSCGCTTPTATKEAVKTFDKGEVLATFNTRSFLGSRSATLTVTFDKPFYAEVQLHVNGYIRSDVVFHPAAVELGTVERGAEVERTISIDYAGRNDWKILKVETPAPYIQTDLVEKSRGGGNVSYELHVSLGPDAPAGYIHDQLQLVTNDQRSGTVPLDIEGRVNSEITVSPSSLFLGVLAPGKSVTKQLVVRASKPFRITEIECENDCFSFKTTDEAKPLHLIPVTFVAGETPGKITCPIRIVTDLGEAAAAELMAHAQISGVEGSPAPAANSVSARSR